MKRQICTIFLILVATATAFSADFHLSAGAGGIFGGFFTRYTLSADGVIDGNRIQVNAGQKLNQLDYGLFAFFDATYGEINVIYQRGSNNYEETFTIAGLDDSAFKPSSSKGWETVLGFSLLGKYPFQLNERISIFPLLGVEYQISLIQRRARPHDGRIYDRSDGGWETDKDGNAYKLSDWNSLWIKLGGGLDFMLPKNFFVRGTVLYAFRTMTPFETKNLELMESQTGDPDPKLRGVTSGPSVRISAGYRFL
jgi:opacity protein-like surface antigen